MPACPHCKREIGGKAERNSFDPRPFRLCPSCGRAYTVDRATKRRQAVALMLAIIALGLTLGMMVQGTAWLIPAIASYIALALYIAWGNRQVVFVPYPDVKAP